jgi:hypothetical protein
MDYETLFVSEFCNQLEDMRRRGRQAHEFYLFQDKRPGSVVERFQKDAAEFADYQKLFRM